MSSVPRFWHQTPQNMETKILNPDHKYLKEERSNNDQDENFINRELSLEKQDAKSFSTTKIRDREDFQYTFLLEFVDRKVANEYKQYVKKQQLSTTYLLWIMFSVVIIATKINFRYGFELGFLFTIPIILSMVGIILLVTILVRDFDTYSGKKLWKSHQLISNHIIEKIIQDELETITIFLFIVAFNITLVAIVLAGECPSNVQVSDLLVFLSLSKSKMK